jgi:RNA polymerase sigma-70 factor (ECF subfamily)
VPSPLSAEQLNAAFRTHALELRQFLRGQLRCAHTAADLTQETWLRLVAHSGQPVDDLRAFIFRIARNLAIDHMRLHGRRSVLDEGLAYLYEVTGDPPELDEVVAAQQELARLGRALEELPEQTQRIFRLSRLHGRPHQQVARELGVSVSTVEKQMARALDHLRTRLQR